MTKLTNAWEEIFKNQMKKSSSHAIKTWLQALSRPL